MATRLSCALISIALCILPACKVGGLEDSVDGGASDRADADPIDETPMVPLTDGTTLTYAATVGFGNASATGALTEFYAGEVSEDERQYYLIERTFAPESATSGDLSDYAFQEDRYYRTQGGKLALYKSVASYTSSGSTSTARYNPPDVRMDSKFAIQEDHTWSTNGTVAITVEQGGDVTYDETLTYRSTFTVVASEEHTVPEGTHSAWKISASLYYGDEEVGIETFCAPDMAEIYRDITPRGSVGRPVKQELEAIEQP